MTSPKVQATKSNSTSNHVITAKNELNLKTPIKPLNRSDEKANKTRHEGNLYDLTEASELSGALKDDPSERKVDSTRASQRCDASNVDDPEENAEEPEETAEEPEENVEEPEENSGEPSMTHCKPSKVESPVPYIENDPQMASLADHMGRAMAFDAAPITNVQVPRDYAFDLELTGSAFWRAHANASRGIKRKHEAELKPPRHGFLAEEVIREGAIQMPGARLPSLTNSIHPLFQREAFDGCEDDVYDQFIPALRLASMFLTHPTCSHFWVTLAWGERIVDPTMTARMGRLQHRIPKDLKNSIEHATKVIKYIEGIAKDYRVHFTFVQRMTKAGMKWAGVTQKVENYSCEVEWSSNEKHEAEKSDLLRIHTRLSSDWYVAAKKLSKLTFPDTAQLLRFSFGFAAVLTHEICHAIELAHIRRRPDWVPNSSWNPELQQEIGHEPFFHNDYLPELGHTWEKYLFGGRIGLINDRLDCLHGLCIQDWPPRSSDIWDSSKIESFTIPMTYIEPLFQMKTWEQDLDISNPKLWHIPRNGARSIYLQSFTTMDYNEEQRIRNEELEELRAEQESKEPAPKKRRTSLRDEKNAVSLPSSRGTGVSLAPQQSEKAAQLTATLAQRTFKKPKSPNTGKTGRGKRVIARFGGPNAEHAAKRVGLGSGKKR